MSAQLPDPLPPQHILNLLGRRFHRLVVTGFTKNKYGSTVCVCECDCGGAIEVGPHDLKYNRVKSCRCLNDELRAERNAEAQRKRAAEFIGKRFANLVVKDVVKREGYRRSFCLAECDCGGKAYAYYSDLISGKVKSCGCLANPLRDLSPEERQDRDRQRAAERMRLYRASHPQVWKPLTPEQREQRKVYREENKEKQRESQLRWMAANPDKVEWYQLVSRCRKFGITGERYVETLDRQNGVCAICKGQNTADKERKLCIDHDHAHCSGSFGCRECFRGLLCDDCNRILGPAHDNPDILRAAADYIDAFRKILKPTEVSA